MDQLRQLAKHADRSEDMPVYQFTYLSIESMKYCNVYALLSIYYRYKINGSVIRNDWIT